MAGEWSSEERTAESLAWRRHQAKDDFNRGCAHAAGWAASREWHQAHAASLQQQLDAERERRLVLEGVLQNIRMANGHLHGCWLVRGGTRCSPECVVVADALAAPAERRGGEVM
jgi:hypothetical protein